MLSIIFESHGTSFDNEAGLSSGGYDVALSPLGEQQARELGERYKHKLPEAVYCSDLKRSWSTAELAFGKTGIPIVQDQRLRECDYGILTRHPQAEVEATKAQYVNVSFPGGKSYAEMAQGMRLFLLEVMKQHDGRTIMIIGSRATQYGLEHWVRRVPLAEAVVAPWQWQPGWTYTLTALE